MCQIPERSDTRTPRRTSFVTTSSSSKAFPRMRFSPHAIPPYMKGAESNTRFTRYFRNRFTNTIPDNPLKPFSGQTGAKPYAKDRTSYLWFGWRWPIRRSCLPETISHQLDRNFGWWIIWNLREEEPHTAFGSNNRMRGPARMNAWSTAA